MLDGGELLLLQYGSVNKSSIVILVRVGGLCITSGDFSRWLTEPYWERFLNTNKNASGRIVSAGKIAVLGGENSFLRL